MKIPTRSAVPANQIVPGDRIELRDDADGGTITGATVKTVTDLGGDRVLLGTTQGPVQATNQQYIKITRYVEL